MTEQTTPQRPGTSRRDFLRRGAIVGGTLVWAAPTVQAFAPSALAHYPNPVCHAEFRPTATSGSCDTPFPGPVEQESQHQNDTGVCLVDKASAPTVCNPDDVAITACSNDGGNVHFVMVQILGNRLPGHGITEAGGVQGNNQCIQAVSIAADKRSATFTRQGNTISRVRILISGP